MLTVDLYAQIRLAHRDGLGIRALARKFGYSRQSIRKALRHTEPPPFRKPQRRHAPKLGPFQAVIDQILADDQKAPLLPVVQGETWRFGDDRSSGSIDDQSPVVDHT